MSPVLHAATVSYLYYDSSHRLDAVQIKTEKDKTTSFDPFESDDEDDDSEDTDKMSDAWEMKISEEKKEKQLENEEIERNWRQEEETEEVLKERQRRETNRRQRGSVEFVHPDLKNELKKQGEDPNNPWVWLTSYSRIPVIRIIITF